MRWVLNKPGCTKCSKLLETKFLFGMYQVLQAHFELLAFDTDQRFFILKSIFSLILRQVLQVCLLFLGLDIFFMVNRL